MLGVAQVAPIRVLGPLSPHFALGRYHSGPRTDPGAIFWVCPPKLLVLRPSPGAPLGPRLPTLWPSCARSPPALPVPLPELSLIVIPHVDKSFCCARSPITLFLPYRTMDFEDQLEKAEKLASPSLVGSSIRSADDSAHNNYIHPEKYASSTDKKKKKLKKASILNSSIGASLDDLMSEGALLGSEEDFTKFLDDEGNIKDDAKYLERKLVASPLKVSQTADEEDEEESKSVKKESPVKPVESVESPEPVESSEPVVPEIKDLHDDSVSSGHTSGSTVAATLGGGNDYSTPNLSEYQLDNQIKDHSDLLDSVKSYDLNRLPSSDDREVSKSNALFAKDSAPVKAYTGHQSNRSVDSTPSLVDTTKNVNFLRNEPDLHTPFFYSDSNSIRPSSRSRSRSAMRNARSQSSSKPQLVPPHLARGDSYKNVHTEEPSSYELPADLDDDRRSRQSKPTLGDIAAAEEKAAAVAAFHSESLTRDPSLVTTGDYTNFNVDTPAVSELSSFATRSLSSTNYLRSISRSRSRQPKQLDRNDTLSQGGIINEKNDANPDELAKEGALINEDPYLSINNLDTMVEDVLHVSEQKKKSNDLIQEETEEKSDVKSVVKKEVAEPVIATKKAIEKDEKKDEEKENIPVTEEPSDEPSEEKPATLLPEEAVPVVEPETDETEEPVEPEAKDVESEDKEPATLISTAGDVATKDEIKEIAKAGSKEEEEPELVTKSKEIETEPIVAEKPESKEKVKPVVAKEKEPVSKEEKEEDEVEPIVTKSKETKSIAKEEAEPIVTKSKEIKPIVKEEDEAEPIVSKSKEIVKEESEVEPIVAKSKEVKEEDETEPIVTKSKEIEPIVKEESETEPIVTKAKDIVKEAEPTVTKSKEIAPIVKEEETEPVTKSKEVKPTVTAPATKETAKHEEDDFDISPEEIRKHLESQPIYLFTSFAGGMQIIPRTNRLATILQANAVKFEYRDLGTDDEAKKIWKRSSNGKTLPGIVRGDDFIGNWQEIDEANEEYKLKELLYETL